MDAVRAMQLVADVLGEQPLSATHMDFGHNSITYEVTLPTCSVMARTNVNAQVFTGTEHNIAALKGLGLPVPVVLASDLTQTRYPFAYMLLAKIPGRDLRYELGDMTLAQMTRLAEQIVGFQRQVMTLPPGTGYGYVPLGDKGLYASWWELLRSDQPSEYVPENSRADELTAQIWHLAKRFESYFRTVPPTCFLDDVTVKNVIVQHGELQGLVDFDCVCYGDPLYWLALTTVGVVSDIAMLGMREMFYIEELKRLWRLPAEQEPILALYSAWIALDFMRRLAAQETPDWNTRMLSAVSKWIKIVEIAT